LSPHQGTATKDEASMERSTSYETVDVLRVGKITNLAIAED